MVAARQMLYYYLRTHTAYSLDEMAAFLRCCHATIIKGAELARKRLETSECFRSDLKRIESDLGFVNQAKIRLNGVVASAVSANW